MQKKYLIIILAVAIIVPQVTSAAWWNPFSWQIQGMWGRIFNKSDVVFSSNCNALTAQINNLIKKANYCQKDSDCVVSTEVAELCQCFSLVNKSANLGKIKEGNAKYSTLNCPEIECAQCPLAPAQENVKCKNKKCVAEQIVGGDKDSHGCIGSAGYSWCEKKQKCLRVWEESCDILSDIYPLFGDLKWGNATPKKMDILNEGKLSGYEITAKGIISDNKNSQDFFNYYKTKLTASGWVDDINAGADGILGGQRGYKKGNDRIVLGFTEKPGKQTSGQNEPLQWTCPCEMTYTIFTGTISEISRCVKDSDCPISNCMTAPCPGYKCINRTCQIKENSPEQACVASGGKVVSQPCYCSGVKDLYSNCELGICTCDPASGYKKNVKNCECAPGKCWNGTKCLDYASALNL